MVAVEITSDLTVETVLEMSPAVKEVLVHHFGAGVTMPGQTWTSEPLGRAAAIRGVDLQLLLDDLKRAAGTIV